MGNYTLRTNDKEDIKIREALTYMKMTVVSRGLLHALKSYKTNMERIKKLELELRKERALSEEKSEAIRNFESGLARMLSYK